MGSFINNIIKDSTEITDDVIVSNKIDAATALSTAYFNATLASSTPELKALFASALTQVLNGHATWGEIAIKNGWSKPYNTSTQQLSEVYNETVTTKQ